MRLCALCDSAVDDLTPSIIFRSPPGPSPRTLPLLQHSLQRPQRLPRLHRRHPIHIQRTQLRHRLLIHRIKHPHLRHNRRRRRPRLPAPHLPHMHRQLPHQLLRPRHYAPRHPRQPRHMHPITLVRLPRRNAMHEHHLILPFPHQHIVIRHHPARLRQLSQLVIMRRKQRRACPASCPPKPPLYRPRQSQPI